METVHVKLTEEALANSCADVECPKCGLARTVELDAYYEVECENCSTKYKVEGCL